MMSAQKNRRTYFLPSVIIILSLLLLMGISYIYLLSGYLGNFTLSDLSGKRSYSNIRVALLGSDYTRRYLESNGGNYDRVLSLWSDLLKNSDIKFKIISDRELEGGNFNYNLLILPATLSLSDEELVRIRHHVSEGMGLILSWACGSRDANGGWRGWEFPEEMAGIKVKGVFTDTNTKSLLLVNRGDSPLFLGIPQGIRMENPLYNEVILAESADYDAYWWREYKLLPADPKNEQGYAASISRNTYGMGRVVWLGFSLDSIVQSRESHEILKDIIYNALLWATRHPLITGPLWPEKGKVPVSVTVDVEEKPLNSLPLTDIFAKEGIKGTFFVLSSMIKEHPRLIDELKKTGEIAIHGDTHKVFAGEPYAVQHARLKKAKEELEKDYGKKIEGVRPVEELYDENTLMALGDLNFNYILINITDRSSPSMIDLSGNKKGILLHRAYYDDFLTRYKLGLTEEETFQYMREDFERTYREGAPYILSLHTTPPWGLLSGEKGIDILKRLIQHIKTREVGIAPCEDIARWWVTRENIKVNLKRVTRNRMVLSITNINAAPVEKAGFYLFLPYPVKDIRVSTEPIYKLTLTRKFPFIEVSSKSFSVPEYYMKEKEKLFLELGQIPQQKTISYFIDMI